jgi:hypothetical protein
MTDMKEVEWVARNEHQWGGKEPGSKAHMAIDGIGAIYAVGCPDGCGVTFEQWKAERERLQNKPKWEDAPGWITHLAQDKDGRWVWYPQAPITICESWSHDRSTAPNGKPCMTASKGKVLGDWRDTLERRPTHIDSSENYIGQHDMHKSDDDVDTSVPANASEWRGPEDGLPPAGTKCEALIPHDPDPLWIEVEVVAHWNQPNRPVFSWVAEADGFYPPAVMQFRPLRTEEDKAVETMIPHLVGKALDYESLCREIYRAGYRKTESEASQ